MSELWLDYSFARPGAQHIKALGYAGVMRYLSLDASKNLTKPEAVALRAAGLKIGLVWETVANRASQGHDAAVEDAKAANAQADALGYPKDAVLFYAVDFDATAAQVKPYFEALKAAPGRPVGLYGSNKLTGIKLAGFNWQTSAWSGGLVDSSANLYQRQGSTVKGAPAGTDENVLLNDFPAWGTQKPKPKPPRKPDDFVIVGWNCYVANNFVDVKNALSAWATAHDPDAFALQEARTHRVALQAFCSDHGYKLYQEKPKPGKGAVVNDNGDSAWLLRNDHVKHVDRARFAKMKLRWKVTDPKHPHTHTPRHSGVLVLHHRGREFGLRDDHAPTHGPKGPNRAAFREFYVRAKAWLLLGVKQPRLSVGDWNATVATMAQAFGKRYTVTGSGIDMMIARNVKHVAHEQLDKGGSDHHAQLYTVTL